MKQQLSVAELKKGGLIEVIWLDAASVKDVRNGDEPASEPDTPISSKGKFLGIVTGRTGMEYLVLDVEEGPNGTDQTIIPLPLVWLINPSREEKRKVFGKKVERRDYCRMVRRFEA